MTNVTVTDRMANFRSVKINGHFQVPTNVFQITFTKKGKKRNRFFFRLVAKRRALKRLDQLRLSKSSTGTHGKYLTKINFYSFE